MWEEFADRGDGLIPESDGKLGYWSLLFIGIGGMVGGGIFAVLGLAAGMSGLATPISFGLAGLVALITSYSYAHLSVTYLGDGGTVEFISRAFGSGPVAGSLNILLWLSYIVMLALYAYAFGSYGSSVFPEDSRLLWKHLMISSVIVGFTIINLLGTLAMAEAEDWLVAIKVSILVFFVAVGLYAGSFSEFAGGSWPASLDVVAGGMIIFVAYEGFELIANAAGEVREPKRNIPRAFYTSVMIVAVLYVAISFVTVGNLTPETIAAAKDYALAESARPFLGSTGFALITVAALLSTSSAINATLYGSARVTRVTSEEGEFPRLLAGSSSVKPIRGLLLTSALTLVVANVVDLTGIALMGSAGFLIIFAAVNFANFKMARQTGSWRLVSAVGGVACVSAVLILVARTVFSDPSDILVLLILIGSAFVVELVYRRVRPHPRP